MSANHHRAPRILAVADAAPQFNDLNATPTATEGGYVVLDQDATVSDADASSFAGATLTLVRHGGENFDDVFKIDGGNLSIDDSTLYYYDGIFLVPIGTVLSSVGSLSIIFNAQATQSLVNATVQQIGYANSNDTPSGSVTIDYVFDNGQQATGSITVTLSASNDAPDLEGFTNALLYTPGDGPQKIGASIVVADIDSTNLNSAAVSINNFQAGAGDVLAAVTTGTAITASFSSGTLILSGSDTLENYQQVLRSVTYESTSADPATAVNGRVDRGISWQLTDLEGIASASGNSTSVTFAPSVDADGSAAGRGFATSFTEHGADIAIVDTDVAIVRGSYGVTKASVVVTDARAGDSLIVGTLPGGVIANIDTSVNGKITLTLTGANNASAYEDALQAISFQSMSDDPGASRTIEIRMGDGVSIGAPATTTIAITEINDSPTVAHLIPDQSVQGGQALNFTFAENSFADVDDASLIYTATLGDGSALPGWLSFDPTSRTFTGTPPVSSVFTVLVKASDGTESITDSFTITTSAVPVPPNRAPVSSIDIGDQTVDAGEVFTFGIPAGAFTDPDGNTLTYSVNGLPSWLHFNTQTQTFTGTPDTGDVGVVALTLTASDGSLSVSDAFNLIVTNPGNPGNEVTLSNASIAENSKKGTVIGAFSGVDGDGDAFASYALNGGSGPFRIDNGTLVLNKSDALDFETKSSYQISVTVTDNDGASFEESFTISLTDIKENPKGDDGKDILEGDALDNIIDGKGGKDKLTGGDGTDTFVFGKGYGRDTITDFDPLEGDRIDLSHAVGIKNFNDLIDHHIVDTGHHIKITAGDGSVLIIKNFEPDALTEDMFIF